MRPPCKIVLTGAPALTSPIRTLSFLEAAQKGEGDFNPPRWRAADDPIAPARSWDWANAAYLLSHFIGEFLLQNEELVPTRSTESGDDAVLAWLVVGLREQRARSKTQQGYKGIRMYDSQKRMWILAAAGYALLVAGSQNSSDSSSGAKVKQGCGDYKQANVARELREIQTWWEEKMDAWKDAGGRLPDRALTDEVLDKVAWLTSEEGEVVIDQLLWYTG